MDDFGRDDSERSDLVEWILYLQFFAVTQHTECAYLMMFILLRTSLN